jgi:hypothetical protein
VVFWLNERKRDFDSYGSFFSNSGYRLSEKASFKAVVERAAVNTLGNFQYSLHIQLRARAFRFCISIASVCSIWLATLRLSRTADFMSA